MKATSATVAVVPQRCATPVVKVRDIAYVRLGRTDLDRAERYYTDFGLTVSARTDTALYFRGALAAHHCWIVEQARRDEFLGLGFTVGAREDLERLARLPGASAIHPIGEPGNGERVTLRDPSGTRVDVIYGMAELAELPVREANTFNTPRHKARVNRPQPADQGRELVFRLGHAVMLLDQLELTLLVNDHVRQHDSTANLVYGPLETLSELTQVTNLAPGDVLLTGTPSGCALRAPAPFVQRLMGLLPEPVKWRAFIKAQKQRDAYLKPGDLVRSTIKSADRRIDLGEQLLRVTSSPIIPTTRTTATQRVPKPTLIGGKS